MPFRTFAFARKASSAALACVSPPWPLTKVGTSSVPRHTPAHTHTQQCTVIRLPWPKTKCTAAFQGRARFVAASQLTNREEGAFGTIRFGLDTEIVRLGHVTADYVVRHPVERLAVNRSDKRRRAIAVAHGRTDARMHIHPLLQRQQRRRRRRRQQQQQQVTLSCRPVDSSRRAGVAPTRTWLAHISANLMRSRFAAARKPSSKAESWKSPGWPLVEVSLYQYQSKRKWSMPWSAAASIFLAITAGSLSIS